MKDFDDGLVVLSNTQPYTHRYEDGEVVAEASVSGLTAALDDVMRRVDGTWVAWGNGEADFARSGDGRVRVPPDEESYTLQRLSLSDWEVDNHYEGFSNRVLWPMCHNILSNLYTKKGYWEAYKQVNDRFADAIIDEVEGEEVVWTQDYHFALVPRQVRHETDAYLAHFWHIPWPAPRVFEACPKGGQILRGLLANDEIGFHTEEYRRNFLDCVERFTDWWVRGNEIAMSDHRTSVVVEPIGVDVSAFEERARSLDSDDWNAFRERYGIDAETVLLGVERLDYMKGIRRRLDALELLFEEYPVSLEDVTYVQKSSISRSSIPEYRTEVEQTRDRIDEINERFSTDDWQPIVHIEDYLSREELVLLYNNADVMLVTSLVDGMNLVSQEYAAAGPEDGTLVLSRFAGSNELFEDAMTVNPYDTVETTRAIVRAIRGPGDLAPIKEKARENDINQWYGGLYR